LIVACPKCSAPYRFDKAKIGQSVSCSKCGHQWSPSSPSPKPTGETHAAKPRAAGAARKPDRMIGRKIDSFEIQQRMGSGGFGVVYRAFDSDLERPVALKILPPNLARAGKHRINRFLREARSAARLSHPNVVTIHEIRPLKDTYYIVMEFIDGGSLDAVMAAQGVAFSPGEATRIIIDAARGLGHAHRRGIIHRDVKPGNIMLTGDGVVKVSDFGLARDVMQVDDIIPAGYSAGTPHYMAPEQAVGEEPTAASDLYGLGTTYYTIIAGRPPYEADDDKQVVEMHRTLPPPDPRKYVPNLPGAIAGIIEKALAKVPADRYQSADEMIQALEQVDLGGETAEGLTPQAVSAQIDRITPEDRGSHLSGLMVRAAKRIQQQPSAEWLAERTSEGRVKRGRWLVILIVVAALAFIAGMITLAFILGK
ncbi:MAG: protein kinase, partial [Phycisphaerae bacterium]|nr:protein kinase [Phycisphaerae bacterium]